MVIGLGLVNGFYDKFMKDLNIIKLGLCFEEQLLKNEKIPVETTDISLNFIVTERGIYECKTK